MSSPPTDHVRRNRSAWDGWAPRFLAFGREAWAQPEPSWGMWGVPDSTLRVLPDVADRDTIELGCGTAYVSAWLARRGARAIGLDNSSAQLAHARGFQTAHDLHFPLLHGDAEHLPLRDGAFDLAISEYGACLWADPHRWVPEAARVVRSGGALIFLTNSALLTLCMREEDGEAATARLRRSHFGPYRFEWSGDGSVDFHLGHGDWIRLLRGNGFEIEDLIEVRAPAGAASPFDFVTTEWAHAWPAEEIWKTRRR